MHVAPRPADDYRIWGTPLFTIRNGGKALISGGSYLSQIWYIKLPQFQNIATRVVNQFGSCTAVVA